MIEMTFNQTLFVMLGLHILADFVLQGWLANGKQRSWWRKTCALEFGMDLEDTKYRYDYLACTFIHALFWSMAVCLPFFGSRWLWAAVLANTVVHAVVDDLKANRLQLSLLQDQWLHFLQIVLTLAAMEGGA